MKRDIMLSKPVKQVSIPYSQGLKKRHENDGDILETGKAGYENGPGCRIKLLATHVMGLIIDRSCRGHVPLSPPIRCHVVPEPTNQRPVAHTDVIIST